MKNGGLIIGVVVVVLIVIGFFAFRGGDSSSSSGEEFEWLDATQQVWYNAEFEDVNSGESFAISDFQGKPVLLESFAVWCPTCTRQQRFTLEFEEEVGAENVISVSLDTDPNEDADRVRKHAEDNGFTWRYAIASTEVTSALVSDFGPVIASAPSVPMILICEDGRARLLDNGLKKVDELKDAVASCGG